MKTRHITLIAVLALAALVLAAGCGEKRTMISSILQQPDRFVDREVAVGGVVSQSYGINLIIAEAGAYQVDDGSGKIWVITRTGTPPVGAEVGLKGKVGTGVRFGREIFGAVINEVDRRVR